MALDPPSPAAESEGKELRIIRPASIGDVPLLLLLIAAWVSWASGGSGFWQHASAAGIAKVLAGPVILIAGWVALSIHDRRSFEKRVRSHPAVTEGHALFAGGCFIREKTGRRAEGLIFLTPEKIVMDLRTRHWNSTMGSNHMSEMKLARITKVTATRSRLTLSRAAFDDLSIRLYKPRLWRDLIERAGERSRQSESSS